MIFNLHCLILWLLASWLVQMPFQFIPVMRCQGIQFGTRRYNTGRINGLMADIIVMLDMVHVDRPGYTSMLIQVTRICPKVWVVHEATNIALEMTYIDRIEADKRSKQTPVRLGGLITDKISLPGQPLLQPVKCFKQWNDRFLHLSRYGY